MNSTFGLDKNYERINFEEVSVEELEVISGGSGWVGAGAASAAAFGIGAAAFGSSWGAVGVGLAFAASPISVAAIGGLALYAGYQAGKAAFG